MLGLGYEKLGQYDDARQALLKARSLDDNPAILEMLVGLYATMGKISEVRAVLTELDGSPSAATSARTKSRRSMPVLAIEPPR
jgi:Flp pilus assembly protein TadD